MKYRKSISGGSSGKFKKLLQSNTLKMIAKDIKKFSPKPADRLYHDLKDHSQDVIDLANAILKDWNSMDEPELDGAWEDFIEEIDDLVMMLEEEIVNAE